MKQPPEDRFMAKVSVRDGIWMWVGGTSLSNGRWRYPTFKLDGRAIGGHRASYMLFVGPIPDGMCVCHKDDNPLNVTPSNLFLGTHQDNMRDRDNKGRHGAIKLTMENVKDILHGPGTLREKASRNGCTSALVHYVIHRKGRYANAK